MPSVFAAQFEHLEADFTNTNPAANAGTLPADDGIDHASLQEYLSRDSSINYHGSAAFMGPLQYQHLYDVQKADGFLDGTCTMAMLELNRPPTFMGARTGLRNTAEAQRMPQAGLGAGLALRHDFGQGCPLDDSDFLVPDLSTDLSGYRLDGFFGSAEQTEATPSFHAGDQPLAGPPAAYQPIGYQKTLAQARLGNVPEHTQLPVSWEMRNNKYFCLHATTWDLERHQNNVHTQTKFFWCRYDGCGRGRPFPRKDKRNEHERKVHHVDYNLAENH
ncbi:hypothetical protein SLS54_000598 [Diplodia seriata]